MNLAVQSSVSGVVVALNDVPNPVFSGKIVGPDVAIAPNAVDGGEVSALAPINGTITKIHLHACIITNDDGYNVLVHLGLDAVSLGGKGFTFLASKEDTTDAGSPVIRWSPAQTETSGLNPIVPVIALEGDEVDLEPISSGHIMATGDMLVTWAQTRTRAQSHRTLIAQCVAPAVITTAGTTASEHVTRLRPICSLVGTESVVVPVPESHLVAHDAQWAVQAHVLGQVVDQGNLPYAISRRSPLAGAFLVGTRLILSTSLPHAVDQGDADQHRGGAYHVAV